MWRARDATSVRGEHSPRSSRDATLAWLTVTRVSGAWQGVWGNPGAVWTVPPAHNALFSREAWPKRGVTMRFRPSRLAAALVFGFLLVSSTAALATTLWVNDPPNTYSPPGTSCTSPGYPTIGAAVAAAVSNDTIMVCDGTYTENVILNKSLTLLGAQFGVDACGRPATESIVTPLIPTNGTLELQTGSAGFTNNCVVNGTTGTGFFVDGTRNVDASTTGARIPMFIGNFIANNGTGVNLGRLAWGDGPISGNTFSNNVFDGLQGGPKNSAISKNTFDSNGRNGLLLTGFGGTTDPARGAQGNTVTQNCFTGNGFPLG